jgi:hypothetical protein
MSRLAIWAKPEKTVYSFPDEMLDGHTGSFGGGSAFSYQFLCVVLFIEGHHDLPEVLHDFQPGTGKGPTFYITGGNGSSR